MKFIWSHSTSHLRTRNFKWQKLKLVVFLKFLFLIEFIFEEYNLGENSSESSEITWLVIQMLTSRAVQSVLFISSQKRILQHKPKSSRTISYGGYQTFFRESVQFYNDEKKNSPKSIALWQNCDPPTHCLGGDIESKVRRQNVSYIDYYLYKRNHIMYLVRKLWVILRRKKNSLLLVHNWI